MRERGREKEKMREKERETDRQTDRQTDKQTDRGRETEIARWTDRERGGGVYRLTPSGLTRQATPAT